MVPFWPLVAMLIGVVVYFGAPNGKVAELGRILFFCSLLVLLMKWGR